MMLARLPLSQVRELLPGVVELYVLLAEWLVGQPFIFRNLPLRQGLLERQPAMQLRMQVSLPKR
jgi:hypothetical protein